MANLNAESSELRDRLTIVETMVSEGRRATGNWGPIFILWGVAFYVAFGWYTLGNHTSLAWPITMMTTFVITRLVHRRRRAGKPKTTMAQAIGSIWIAMILSMFVFFIAISRSHDLIASNVQTAVLATMLGSSNAACALLLRWKQQFACAVIWWAAAVVACFGTAALMGVAFMAAAFCCWIVFGIYVTISESRTSAQAGVAHA